MPEQLIDDGTTSREGSKSMLLCEPLKLPFMLREHQSRAMVCYAAECKGRAHS